MPKFNVTVRHEMRREVVVSRLRSFSDQIRENAAMEVTILSEEWDESGNLAFAFQAMGMQISGNMLTSEDDVVVDGNLPFAAAMFRGAIETQIREQIRAALQE